MTKPEIKLDIRQDEYCQIREQLCPDGWSIIDVYHPCSTVTPWDYYGMRHQREYRKVLSNAGIESISLVTNKTLLHPMGTGPGGSVRFGDNMTPGTYRIAVEKGNEGKAAAAIAEHKNQIQLWLDDKAEMPEACRH